MEKIIATESEKALIMGTLLGDAHIQKRGNSYRLKIEHGIDQEAYVMWKYDKLKNLCSKPPKKVTSKKGHTTVLFYTKSGLYLKSIYDLFYKEVGNGRFVKIITNQLIDALPLEALTLASFFMDDGSVRSDCYAGKLATQGFSLAENKLLCEWLARFGINGQVVVHLKSKNQYYITIPAKSFPFLVEVISPIIVNELPSMFYKLNSSKRPRND
jgi:hypothetical protein